MLKWIDNNAVLISVLLCVASVIFICVGHVYREQVQTALKCEFVTLPSTTFDWWSLSHLVLFALLGFLIPNYHFTFFLLGAGFEVLEDALSSDATTQLVNCTMPDAKCNNLMCRFSINDDYWYAKWDDVFINLVGYTIGSSVRSTCFT
jgi:hypothetical protein